MDGLEQITGSYFGGKVLESSYRTGSFRNASPLYRMNVERPVYHLEDGPRGHAC